MSLEELAGPADPGPDVSSNSQPESGHHAEIEEVFRDILSEVCRIPKQLIQRDRTCRTYGVDSLSAMEIVARSRERGLKTTVDNVLKGNTIALIASQMTPVNSMSEPHPEPEENSDELFGLAPAQIMYFENMHWPRRMHSAVLLRCTGNAPVVEIRKALALVVKRHTMLRTRFSKESGRWMQRHLRSDVCETFAFTAYQVSEGEIGCHVAKSHEGIDLVNGPVFSAVVLDISDRETRLLSLIAHHVTVDMVSWRVIVRELNALLDGRPLTGPVPSSFKTWQSEQSEQGRRLEPEGLIPVQVTRADMAFWSTPQQRPLKSYTVKHIRLDKKKTISVFNSICIRLGCEVTDLMIAAMFTEFYQVFPERKEKPLTVWIQTHGRERLEGVDVDPLQMVGWFNYFTPICIPAEGVTDLRHTLLKVASLRRSIPGNGLPYFSSRFFNERSKDAFAHHWPLEVRVNYTGRRDALTDGNSVLTQQMEYDLGVDAAEVDAETRDAFDFQLRRGSNGRWTIGLDAQLESQHTPGRESREVGGQS